MGGARICESHSHAYSILFSFSSPPPPSSSLFVCVYLEHRNPTSLVKGKILLCENTKEETTLALEKYAFSNAMALSGKINNNP